MSKRRSGPAESDLCHDDRTTRLNFEFYEVNKSFPEIMLDVCDGGGVSSTGARSPEPIVIVVPQAGALCSCLSDLPHTTLIDRMRKHRV